MLESGWIFVILFSLLVELFFVVVEVWFCFLNELNWNLGEFCCDIWKFVNWCSWFCSNLMFYWNWDGVKVFKLVLWCKWVFLFFFWCGKKFCIWKNYLFLKYDNLYVWLELYIIDVYEVELSVWKWYMIWVCLKICKYFCCSRIVFCKDFIWRISW